jgi:hypothetical protein
LYRTRKGGRERLAVVSLAHPDQRAALENVLGEPAREFRLVKVSAQAAAGPRTADLAKDRAGVTTAASRLAPALAMDPVEIDAVMPLYRHPLAACSEIAIVAPHSFPELMVWKADGRPGGWNFGLPLPQAFWRAAA